MEGLAEIISDFFNSIGQNLTSTPAPACLVRPDADMAPR